MHRSRFLVCAAALAWMAALGSSTAATLSVKGGSGTGGGTIVRGGTGDASNTDQSATGSTDSLAALGFTTPTLAGLTSDLEALTFFVTVSNADPLTYPADLAQIQSLKVFVTAPSECSLDGTTQCAELSTITAGFPDIKYDTGPDQGQNVDLTLEQVVASVQFAGGAGLLVPFDTVQTFSLTSQQAADMAALLLAAFPQGLPGSPYSADSNFLNLLYLGFSVQARGVSFDAGSGQYVETAPANTVITTNPVPEPGTLILLGSGLLSSAAVARRRRKSTRG